MVVDGVALTMLSCTPCDDRSWHRDGSPIALGEMLASLSRRDFRFVRMGTPADHAVDTGRALLGQSLPSGQHTAA